MLLLFTKICERLADRCPELNYIDWDAGQYEKNDLPLSAPAALISIEVEWANEAFLNQSGEATISVRIWAGGGEESHFGAGRQGGWLEKLQIIDKVHWALQGFSNTHFTALMRTRTERDADTANGVIITCHYACGLFAEAPKTALKTIQFQ